MEDERKTKKQLIEELNCLRLEQIEQTKIISEKFTKAFLQNSIPITITTVKDGSFVEVSDAFLRLVELKRDEVIGHTAIETGFITEEQRAFFYNELSKNGRVENLEMEVRPKGRGLRYGLFNVVMMSINNENYLLTTIQDITERKLVEEQLRASEIKYRGLHQSMRDAFVSVDMEGRINDYNDVYLNMLGYTPKEISKLTYKDITPEKWHVLETAIVEKQVLPKGYSDIYEKEYRRKDGAVFPAEMRTTLLRDAKGVPISMWAIARDITERKRNEKELRNSEEKFRILFNSGKDFMAVHLTGKDGMPTNFVHVNDATCELLGYTKEEMLQLKPQDIDLASSSGLVPAIIEKFIKDKHVLFETEMITKNGQSIPMEVSLTLFQLQDSEATLCVARDITDRKRAESQREAALDEIAKSEKKHRILLEESSDPIFSFTPEGQYKYVNRAFADGVGKPIENIIGKKIWDIFPKEEADKRFASLSQVFRTGAEKTIEVRVPRTEGDRYYMTTITPIKDAAGEVTSAICSSKDITDRKQVEHELAKSEEKYRLITENIMDCVFLIDANGVFQYATNLKATLGYELEDLIGITGMSITHPDELERIQRIYEGGVDGVWQAITYETRLRHKDGHYVPMEIRGRTFTDPSEKIAGAVFAGREIIQDQQKKQKRQSAKKSASTITDLNSREKEILNWVIQGKSTWDISKIVDIGEGTVKYHIDKIMKKLSAVNRTHAVAIAMQNELLD